MQTDKRTGGASHNLPCTKAEGSAVRTDSAAETRGPAAICGICTINNLPGFMEANRWIQVQ